MKFSASSVLFPEIADRAEIARRVAQAGYEGIEWRVQTDYHVDPDRIGAEAGDLAAVCRDNGLKVVCLATYLNWSELDRIREVARAAQVLDCPRIRLAGFNYDGKEPYWTVYDRAVRQIEAAARYSGRKASRASSRPISARYMRAPMECAISIPER